MSFLLDTNICSAYVRGNRQVFNRCIQHSGGLYVASVALGELYTWALRAAAPPQRMAALNDVLALVVVLDLDHAVARQYGLLRAALLDAGRPTPETDLMIASTALHHDLTLVTHNVKDFAHLPGLRIEDWLAP